MESMQEYGGTIGNSNSISEAFLETMDSQGCIFFNHMEHPSMDP